MPLLCVIEEHPCVCPGPATQAQPGLRLSRRIVRLKAHMAQEHLGREQARFRRLLAYPEGATEVLASIVELPAGRTLAQAVSAADWQGVLAQAWAEALRHAVSLDEPLVQKGVLEVKQQLARHLRTK